jgi:subtilisin family serine protease
MRKSITLVLILVMISMSPTSASLASNNVKIEEISTATACRVSLLSIWQVYGVPYPCFVEGTQLSIAAPIKTNLDSRLLIKVNSDIRSIAWGSIFEISNYTLGLNSVEFGVTNENKNFVQIGHQIKFIVYSSSERFFSDQRVSSATPYVVVLRDDANVSSIALEVGISNQSYMTSSVSGGKTQSFANSSIFVMDLDPSQLILMQGNSNVEAIARQQIRYLSDVQASPPSWGLDRINQPTLPLDSSYDYKRTGKGVEVYVVDSGINNSHSDFAGRIGQGAYRATLGSTEDCNGHGTHVSGTVAGSSYGVAKEATIIPVRVAGCTGDLSLSDVIAAYEWVIENHADADPAVVNISLGGAKSSLENLYIQEMIDDGLVVVVAAGNDYSSACNYSPSSAPNAITVAASTIIDTDATYSNIGSCVDIFAPGSSITSAWIGSSSTSNTIDGTSMASPHVAGAAALVLEKDFTGYVNKLDANSLVRNALLYNATNNALSASDGSSWWPTTTNTLLNTSFITGGALTPAFSASIQTVDGFTLQISNFDASFAWAGTNSSAGAVVISSSGLITVTGVAPGVSSTVTITTTRTGYTSGSATSSSIFAYDTVVPTVTVGRSGSGTLGAGQTASLTFVLSESATNFVVGDVTVSGGSLSSFAGSGTSYTATFTLTATGTSTASVSVAAGAFTDAAGNDNTASNSLSIAYDTVVPTTTTEAPATSDDTVPTPSTVPSTVPTTTVPPQVPTTTVPPQVPTTTIPTLVVPPRLGTKVMNLPQVPSRIAEETAIALRKGMLTVLIDPPNLPNLPKVRVVGNYVITLTPIGGGRPVVRVVKAKANGQVLMSKFTRLKGGYRVTITARNQKGSQLGKWKSPRINVRG